MRWTPYPVTLHDPPCPIIGLKSPKSLARILGYPLSHLEELCDNIRSQYKKKEIPKKNGKIRVLSVPKGQLKNVQSSILNQLKKFSLHPAAYGAISGRCHIDNARQHAAAPYVYCLDFSAFFPSVSSNRIYTMFHEELGCSPPVSGILTKLTTYKYQLPTGAPTSPVLTNILCYPLDKRLNDYSKAQNIKYTRFVDDLTFSGRYISDQFCEEVKGIIGSYGLPLNKKKEEFLTPHTLKEVTGINVNAKKVRVTRSYKRKIRAQKYQLEQAKGDMTRGEVRDEKRRIFGKEQYVRMVRFRKSDN